MDRVWLAQEDNNPAAGSLFFHPGWHRRPIMANALIGWRDYGSVPSSAQGLYGPAWSALCEAHCVKEETLLAHKWQSVILCANLLHRGSRQIDPPPPQGRHKQRIIYFDDCIYCTPVFSDEAVGRLDLRHLGKAEYLFGRGCARAVCAYSPCLVPAGADRRIWK